MKTLITRLIGAALILGSTHSFATTTLYSVTNVPDESALILRALPGNDAQPLSNIPISATTIEGTGKTTVLNSVVWIQVVYKQKIGWLKASFLKQTQFQQTSPVTADNPATKVEITDTAEIFSYPSQSKPEHIPKSTKLSHTQYPWSETADSIYDDPTPDNKIQPINTTVAQIPQVINTNAPELPTAVAAPTIAAQQPQPVVIGSTTDTVFDYRDENVAVNRYETVETPTTMGFIED